MSDSRDRHVCVWIHHPLTGYKHLFSETCDVVEVDAVVLRLKEEARRFVYRAMCIAAVSVPMIDPRTIGEFNPETTVRRIL